MKNIEINEIHEEVVLNAEAMEAVKGGPAYIKFDGVEGESKFRSAPSRSLTYEEIKVT